ncbi:TPA: hypothetical protein N0F65_002988 [Lagenidium giganteum]|uniref:Protein kinase domain-containing protein n=1 Tax=Lagenidium giganteum TaxID=4803 RepID=A0AAV2YQU3_9STRA|nr:TPA: hypothetical protein N0F65_002988 [Lagenidium giganteum]
MLRLVKWQNLFPGTSASAILFHRCSFWLIKRHKLVVVTVEIGMRANNGSKSLFQNFITDNVSPWVTAWGGSCLGVEVANRDTFLGPGAHGCVFKITRQDGEVVALKIVEKIFTGRFYQEEKALMSAQHAVLLTTPVGNLLRVRRYSCLQLGTLHLDHVHDSKHGASLDCYGSSTRVASRANVPLRKKLLWIDLVEAMETSPTLK